MITIKDISKKVSRIVRQPILLKLFVISLFFIVIMRSMSMKYRVDFEFGFGDGIHFCLSPTEQSGIQPEVDMLDIEQALPSGLAAAIE